MSSKNPGAAGEAKSASPKKQARKSPRKRPAATVESTIYGLTEADAGILRELCTGNGLKFPSIVEQGEPESDEEVNAGGIPATVIECFFFGVPWIPPMSIFTGLTTLRLVDQTISRIDGLDECVQLQELWIAECQLTKIANLSKLVNLEILHLYTNKISKIEGLSTLTKLRTLWLASNRITVIENIENLTNLLDLNLANNQISTIEKTLDVLSPSLERLNLSGNPIRSLAEYHHIARLQQLRILSIRDPRYSSSAAAEQPNATTFILYHLPGLKVLDGEEVAKQELRRLLDSIVEKKSRFYRQQEEGLQRTAQHLQRQMHYTVLADTCNTYRHLRNVESVGYQLKFELEKAILRDPALESNPSTDEASEPLKKVVQLSDSELEGRVKEYEAYREETLDFLQGMEAWSQFHKANVGRVHQYRTERLNLQFKCMGNVVLEEGTPNTPWYLYVRHFVHLHQCQEELRALSLQIDPILVTRIVNHRLHKQCADSISKQLAQNLDGDAWLSARNKFLQKEAQHLIYIKANNDGKSWISAVDTGCEPEQIADTDLEGALVTDDLVTYCKFGAPLPLRANETQHCHFLLVETVLGDVTLASDADRSSRKSNTLLLNKGFKTGNKKLDDAVSNSCGHNIWLIRERWRLLPEYIIDFNVQPSVSGTNSFSIHDNGPDIRSLISEARNPFSLVQDLPKLPNAIDRQLTMSTPCSVAPAGSKLQPIVTLDLSCCKPTGLGSIPFSKIEFVSKLVLNNNELSVFPAAIVRMEVLEELHMDYNFLTDVKSMPACPNLQVLSLRCNNLLRWRENIAEIRRMCPNLTSLDMRLNPWQSKQGMMRSWVVGAMPNLLSFDGCVVEQRERQIGQQMLNNQQIFTSLDAGAVTVDPSVCTADSSLPKMLELKSVAASLVERNLYVNGPVISTPVDVKNITALCFENQNLARLAHFSHLVNLRWLTLTGNCLVRLEGIQRCTKLEELVVNDNALENLDGLGSLVNLQHLVAGNNFISSLEESGIGKLKKLQILSIPSNFLTSLSPLEKVTSLAEFYVGNNLLPSIRCLFPLKVLKELRNVDLLGNRFCTTHNDYRLATLHILARLHSLDGVVVEAPEIATAREKYDGWLNLDYLADYVNCKPFYQLTELDLPGCGLKQVDLGSDSSAFPTIRSLNLQNNQLTSIQGLTVFKFLRVLCLTKNCIEHIVGKPVPGVVSRLRSSTSSNSSSASDLLDLDKTPLFASLEILHLGHNYLTSMAYVQLHRFPSLVALYLQGNAIQYVDQPAVPTRLRELVLDSNRIRDLDLRAFACHPNLRMLHIEQNRLKSLNGFEGLNQLENLYLGANLIKELVEVEKLITLSELKEVSLLNNPVSRQPLHRPLLILRQSKLTVIDGQAVTAEERQGVVQYFIERQHRIDTALTSSLPNYGPDTRTHGPLPYTVGGRSTQHSGQQATMLPSIRPNPESQWLSTNLGGAPAQGHPLPQPFQTGNIGQHHLHHDQRGKSNRSHRHQGGHK